MMRFYINILATYFPDIDPPYDGYYRQILEQVELAEELGWECIMFNEHHFLGYGGLVANPAVLAAQPHWYELDRINSTRRGAIA